MAASVVRTPDGVADRVAGVVPDLPRAVERISRVTPDRVVVSHGNRVLNYRDLTAAIALMMPVTRSQQMDDRAAVVAAIFAGLPALGSEVNSGVVAAVVDAAMARVVADVTELPDEAPAVKRARSAATNEIDLRVIASRLAGA